MRKHYLQLEKQVLVKDTLNHLIDAFKKQLELEELDRATDTFIQIDSYIRSLGVSELTENIDFFTELEKTISKLKMELEHEKSEVKKNILSLGKGAKSIRAYQNII